MRVRNVGVVRVVIDAGPDDRVFDVMLLCGPLVIAVLAVAGRSPLTVGLVALYLLAFVGYVVYNAASDDAA